MTFYINATAPIFTTGVRLGRTYSISVDAPSFRSYYLRLGKAFFATIVEEPQYAQPSTITQTGSPFVQALGAHVIAGPITASPIFERAFGVHNIVGPIQPSSLVTQALGTHRIDLTVIGTGFVLPDRLSAPTSVIPIISPQGLLQRTLPSAVVAGPIVASALVTRALGGHGLVTSFTVASFSVQALGAPRVVQMVTPQGLDSRAFGTAVLHQTLYNAPLSRFPFFGAHYIGEPLRVFHSSLVARSLFGGVVTRRSGRLRPSSGQENSTVELLTTGDLVQGWTPAINVFGDSTQLTLVAGAGSTTSTTSTWSSSSIDVGVELAKLEADGPLSSTSYIEFYVRFVQAGQHFEIAYRRTRDKGFLRYGSTGQTTSVAFNQPSRLRLISGGSNLSAYVDGREIYAQRFARTSTSAEIGVRTVGISGRATVSTERRPVVTFAGYKAPITSGGSNRFVMQAPEGLEGSVIVAADFGTTENAGTFTYVSAGVVRVNRDSGVRVSLGRARAVVEAEISLPAILGSPTISGYAAIDQILTAIPAQVTGSPTPDRTWAWYRGSSVISGATSSTYTVMASDFGYTISVVQTETNSAGSASAQSAPTEIVTGLNWILATGLWDDAALWNDLASWVD